MAACAISSPDATLDHPPRPADIAPARVIQVLDGDSIEAELDGATTELRLLGVNANEMGECHYEESREFLSGKVEGAEVGIETAGTDQFGRSLAMVWLDDELINLTLVDAGMAISQTLLDDNAYTSILIRAEDRAASSGAGLWSPRACGSDGELPRLHIDLDRSEVDPAGPDGDHLGEEFIVIVNDATEPLDLGGWTLRDGSSRHRLVLPEGTTLDSGGQLSVITGCGPSPSWCSDEPIWNNAGDIVMLLDSNGTVVAHARY